MQEVWFVGCTGAPHHLIKLNAQTREYIGSDMGAIACGGSRWKPIDAGAEHICTTANTTVALNVVPGSTIADAPQKKSMRSYLIFQRRRFFANRTS